MTHNYLIQGMTCGSCISKVKSELLKIGDIINAEVQLRAPHATVTMQKHVPLPVIQQAISKAGNYTITESLEEATEDRVHVQGIGKYKPLILVAAFITGTTLAVQISSPQFNWHHWMSNFMAAFFLTFSFFKMLNLKGFAESYSSYDIIARRWIGWGYVYAFIELFLGLAYLVNFNPVITNSTTFIVMSVGIVGVLQTVLAKRKIKCACLGAVFDLPMSTVTVVENLIMISMSLMALVSILS